MSFNITRCDQSEWIDTSVKRVCFKYIRLTSEKTGFIRASCIFIGLGDCLLTIAKRVSLVAENILKGVLNILGSPLIKECSLKTGLEQIFIEALLKHVLIFPFTVVSAGYNLVNTTIRIAKEPEIFAYKQWNKYDPGLKDRTDIYLRETQHFKMQLGRNLIEIENSKKQDPLTLNIKNKPYGERLIELINDTNELIKSQRESFKDPYGLIRFDEYFKDFIKSVYNYDYIRHWDYIRDKIPEIEIALRS